MTKSWVPLREIYSKDFMGQLLEKTITKGKYKTGFGAKYYRDCKIEVELQ